MVNHITTKKCEKISHREVATEFLHQGEKKYNTYTNEGKNPGNHEKKGKKYHGGQGGGEPKKTRVINPWSNKLKEVFLEFDVDLSSKKYKKI